MEFIYFFVDDRDGEKHDGFFESTGPDIPDVKTCDNLISIDCGTWEEHLELAADHPEWADGRITGKLGVVFSEPNDKLMWEFRSPDGKTLIWQMFADIGQGSGTTIFVVQKTT